MNNRYEEEKERILEAVRNMMERFGPYMKECELGWPICYRCKEPMCQVIHKGDTTYFQCFETPNGKLCGHREYGI